MYFFFKCQLWFLSYRPLKVKILYRSHVTKIILRILLLRARSRITPEIEKEQFGFVEDAGTRNVIFVLRNIIEQAVEMQKDVYVFHRLH